MPGSYLFSEIGRRVRAYQADDPSAKLIRLGIGDVTRPLPQVCIGAMKRAADELGSAATFRGYGPDQGYDFLRSAISEHEYGARGADISPDEIFISDGAKSDSANVQELFSPGCVVAAPDPVYPVYVDSNALSGRAGVFAGGKWTLIEYLPCVAENGFAPPLPEKHVDLIYLCFPNNPTGATIERDALKAWVDYAREHEAIIIYDAAYRRYITRPGVPRSIYEIEGSREAAIEVCSFSKTAGFTGVRCSWTVVPKELNAFTSDGKPRSLRDMWLRRQTTKFNGAPYVVQRAAEAIYSPEGGRQVEEMVGYYQRNAQIIMKALLRLGVFFSGGVDAPYIWFRCPGGDSWAFFDRLLKEAHVVGTPGAGFGPHGEGYFRLTAFGSEEDTREACDRLGRVF
jgi:LL-diaminopimelate aminotransferase